MLNPEQIFKLRCHKMQRLTDSILLLEDNLMFGLLLGKLRHSKDLYFNEGLVIIREADFSPRRR